MKGMKIIMDYEMMVKEAYDEIMGFEKEARAYDELVQFYGNKFKERSSDELRNAFNQVNKRRHVSDSQKTMFPYVSSRAYRTTGSKNIPHHSLKSRTAQSVGAMRGWDKGVAKFQALENEMFRRGLK